MLLRAPAGVRFAQLSLLVPVVFFGIQLASAGPRGGFVTLYAGSIAGGFAFIELLSWFRGTWFRMMVLVLTMGVAGLAILIYFLTVMILLPVAICVIAVYLGPGAGAAYRRASDPF